MFSESSCRTCFSNTLCFLETVFRGRQSVCVPSLFINDSAGTTWNRDGPPLPPHPEGAWSRRCTSGGQGRGARPLVLCLSLSDDMRKWEVERYWIMNDFLLTVHRWESVALNQHSGSVSWVKEEQRREASPHKKCPDIHKICMCKTIITSVHAELPYLFNTASTSTFFMPCVMNLSQWN